MSTETDFKYKMAHTLLEGAQNCVYLWIGCKLLNKFQLVETDLVFLPMFAKVSATLLGVVGVVYGVRAIKAHKLEMDEL